jgi:palmitoyl-protein thioesterase
MRSFTVAFLFACLVGANAMSQAEEDKLAQSLIDDLLQRAEKDPAGFAQELRESEFSTILQWPGSLTVKANKPTAEALPLVFAHGMGDSCFNSGMKQITADAGTHAGVYSVCVPTGNNTISDTINGFLMNMDKSVDVFADKIMADPKLKNGFNAIGFSQGNSLIRGYIQKYNGAHGSPVCNAHLSVHGTVYGVAGFPQCNPAKSGICAGIAKLLGDLAYNKLVQGIFFQANYLRDPFKTTSTDYLTNSQIADWNNEGSSPNGDYKTNFGKTQKFIMVKADGDTMVFPNDGEWWGTFADNSFDASKKLAMKDTRMYKSDLFGLQSADNAKKIFFESTTGNHLQFTEQQLYGWMDKYLA